MRSELIELEEVNIWNEWVRGLREVVLGGGLGGDRKELWREVARSRVGLVENKEVEGGGGGVGEEEARKVSFVVLLVFRNGCWMDGCTLPIFFICFCLSPFSPLSFFPPLFQSSSSSSASSSSFFF